MNNKRLISLLSMSITIICVAYADNYERMAKCFAVPQDSTRTKVWWFHGETETTKQGITADLEAYKQKGVGGVVYYDQVHGKGEGAAKVFSKHWWNMLVFSSLEAKRLSLVFDINASNGYVAGGKWITPDKSMQRLETIEKVVEGGSRLCFRMPLPRRPHNYHKDVALVAIPYNDSLMSTTKSIKLKMSTNVSGLNATDFFSEHRQVSIPEMNKPIYINMDFGKPFTARSITYTASANGKARTSSMNVPGKPDSIFYGCGYRQLPDIGMLEVSDDGVSYRLVRLLEPKYRNLGGVKQKTLSFPSTTGRYFRIQLHSSCHIGKDAVTSFGNVVLSSRAMVDDWQEKASLVSEFIEGDHTPKYSSSEIIDGNRIVDITKYMNADGDVVWDAPDGKWLVMRFVSVSTGGHTKHGRAEALGLECDKLSVEGARLQWKSYVKPIIDTLRVRGGRLDGITMDSHEAGPQNWTPGMENDFSKLRGYDMKRYLPVMAGLVVGSRDESDGFLFDLRRTISDLITNNYYGEFNRLANSEGLELTAQAVGGALCMAGDNIEVKKLVDKPQGEFWAYQTEGNYDIKDCASAAHVYGKQIASGEAFTDATYRHSLSDIKSLADYAWCFGINEFVVCASTYQPWTDRIPGNTANGRQYCLNRNNTFWQMSKPFWDYQSRGSYMMRQGKPVADLCLYLGENVPVRTLAHKLPDIPKGFDFDSFTTDVLLNRMSVKEGNIVLPDGLSFRMMLLPRDGEITLKSLRKIAALVYSGAVVWGVRPWLSGSYLTGVEKLEYASIVNRLWGSESAIDRKIGLGRVLSGMPLSEAVKRCRLNPDIVLPETEKIYFAHRRTKDCDIYIIDNHQDKNVEHDFIFNTPYKNAEFWDAVTGKRYMLDAVATSDGRLKVTLPVCNRGAFFILASNRKSDCPKYFTPTKEVDQMIDGKWTVAFDEKLGGPGIVEFQKLEDWTNHSQKGIKYYSGTAVYKNTFKLADKDNDARYVIRFQKLYSVAEIFVNGKMVETVWCSPWEADVSNVLKKGKNKIEIRVANSLYNRMIGDASLSEADRVTCSTHQLVKATDCLVPSGIIGDVSVVKQY